MLLGFCARCGYTIWYLIGHIGGEEPRAEYLCTQCQVMKRRISLSALRKLLGRPKSEGE